MNKASQIIDQLLSLKEQLLEQKSGIQKTRLLHNLQGIIADNTKDSVLADMIMSDTRIINGTDIFNDLLMEYERDEEDRAAEAIKKKEDIISNYHFTNTINKYKQEGDVLGMTRHSNVLFLGSGSLPISCIFYQYYFDCHVTCVDIRHEAINLSQNLIYKLNIADHFTFRECRAEDAPLTEHDVVIVATACSNKTEIFQRLLNIKPRPTIGVRNPINLYRLYYPYYDLSGLGVKSVTRHNWNNQYPTCLEVIR